jgi:hypothetical protein
MQSMQSEAIRGEVRSRLLEDNIEHVLVDEHTLRAAQDELGVEMMEDFGELVLQIAFPQHRRIRIRLELHEDLMMGAIKEALKMGVIREVLMLGVIKEALMMGAIMEALMTGAIRKALMMAAIKRPSESTTSRDAFRGQRGGLGRNRTCRRCTQSITVSSCSAIIFRWASCRFSMLVILCCAVCCCVCVCVCI